MRGRLAAIRRVESTHMIAFVRAGEALAARMQDVVVAEDQRPLHGDEPGGEIDELRRRIHGDERGEAAHELGEPVANRVARLQL